MSSIEIAHAILMGTTPERRVSVCWHKQAPYTTTVIEETPSGIWREVNVQHFVSRKDALKAFARIVDHYWDGGGGGGLAAAGRGTKAPAAAVEVVPVRPMTDHDTLTLIQEEVASVDINRITDPTDTLARIAQIMRAADWQIEEKE